MLDFTTGRWQGSQVLDEIFGIDSSYEHSLEGWARLIHPEDREPVMQHFLSLALSREPLDKNYRIIRQNDGQIRWLHGRGRFSDAPATPADQLFGTLQDITAQKLVGDQLLQAQKMEAVGLLAGGVAHDFNNILSAMLMQLSLVRSDPAMPREIMPSLEDVEAGVHRAASLTRQLLTFSRRQLPQKKPIELNILLENLLKMLHRILGEHIRLVIDESSGPAWIEADPGMMEQIIMNLCVNARDAMPNGGRLTLGIHLMEIDEASAKAQPLSHPGKFACLSVADTGCGMDPATLKRIFEPFFTTKDVGKGTGLGLATVQSIAAEHHGWVEVESRVGEGAVFRVYLPMCTAAPIATSEASLASLPRGQETILLVEDDDTCRTAVSRSLKRLGYNVLEAAHGVEATQRWGGQIGQIPLLLTDMILPEGMTGLQLAQYLLEKNPMLKVIISSGYSREATRPETFVSRDIHYLEKPYKIEALATLIRQCLAQH